MVGGPAGSDSGDRPDEPMILLFFGCLYSCKNSIGTHYMARRIEIMGRMYSFFGGVPFRIVVFHFSFDIT